MSDTTVIGNVGEPSLKFLPSGKAVLEFSLAENHSKKNAQGGWDEDGTTWRRVTLWDKKGEALADVLKKGDRVIVTGSERMREWESKDGGKGQSLELNAREVGIIVRAPKNSGGQESSMRSQGNWGNQPASDPWAAPAPAQSDGWGNGPSNEPTF
jgi:single-strand DNA-binding protein